MVFSSVDEATKAVTEMHLKSVNGTLRVSCMVKGWPWVKNYGGELRAGANRPGPIYARIWIDQELKEEMGF